MYFIELGINHVVGDEKVRYPYAAFLQQQPFSAYRPMWKLKMRGARGTPFVEAGNYASLAEAADVILKMENDVGWVFFNVPVGTLTPMSDAEALSCLTYQGKKHYYVVTRSAN